MNETNIIESKTIRDESKCMKMDLSDRLELLGGMKILLGGLYGLNIKYMVPTNSLQTNDNLLVSFWYYMMDVL